MSLYAKLIDPTDAEQVESQRRLLDSAGIHLDPLIDWSLALYDGDKMLATASCFRYTLRSIAVDNEHQGLGMMARLITAVEKEATRRSLDRLLLISQPEDKHLFSAVGFTSLAESRRGVAIMENSSQHFPDFLKKLKADLSEITLNETATPRRAAIVMNANPFSLGHRFLVETALRECDQLLLLVLSDDPQYGFGFEHRFEMVKRGCADLPRVLVAASGPYAVSTASFPSYFYPPTAVDENSQLLNDEAELDAALFVCIANYLNISKRFVGSEPGSDITNFYNQVLSRELVCSGLQLQIIDRLSINGKAVSASSVRNFLDAGDYNAAKKLVPATTWNYLKHLYPIDTASGTEN